MIVRSRCATPNCTDSTHARGLCAKCFHKVYRDVRLGRTTWEELEARGITTPKHPRYREGSDHPPCVLKGCERTGDGGRGLCPTHYSRGQRFIRRGLFTWEELEKLNFEPIEVSIIGRPRGRHVKVTKLTDELEDSANEVQQSGEFKFVRRHKDVHPSVERAVQYLDFIGKHYSRSESI